MRWFHEDSDGIVGTGYGIAFDHRLVDYALDVQRVLDKLSAEERLVLVRIHRDGVSYGDACMEAGLAVKRPDAFVSQLEAKIGRLLYVSGLADLSKYFSR